MAQSRIRNFSIIAHIDHGKSTLADRFIQRCGGLSDREMAAQVLDSMDLERERGITIKAQTACAVVYRRGTARLPAQPDRHAGPRRLRLRGVALAVGLRRRAAGGRRSQGVEAQTVANCYTAIEQGVEVMPVLNKIDLPSADPERVDRAKSRTSSASRRSDAHARQRQDRRRGRRDPRRVIARDAAAQR